jgi:hypothetical protein
VILYIGIGILILSFLSYQSYRVRQKGKKDFEMFYTSVLDGEISSIAISVGVVYLQLDNALTEYAFIPRTSELNKNQIFSHIARKGDKVIKPAYSDTLKLVKGDKVYLYTFQKLTE